MRLHIILKSNYSLLLIIITLFFLGCAKEEDEVETSVPLMSQPSIEDGYYKITGYQLQIYYKSSGSLYNNYIYSITHDTAFDRGYFGYYFEWRGNGIYRNTMFGKGTFSDGSENLNWDCSTETVRDETLNQNGVRTKLEYIQTGCGGSSSSLDTVIDNTQRNFF